MFCAHHLPSNRQCPHAPLFVISWSAPVGEDYSRAVCETHLLPSLSHDIAYQGKVTVTLIPFSLKG